MTFVIVLLALFILIAIIVSLCTESKEDSSRQEEYLNECARRRLIQKQDEDNDLD